MPGIFGDGQRGGIFGAKIDPRLAEEMRRRRIEEAFAASEGMQEPSRALYEAKHRRAQEGQPVEPGFWSDVASLGPRAVGGAQKMWEMAPAAAGALWNDPLGSINRAGLAGQAATDAVLKGMVEPFTQFGDPNVNPVQQGADLGLTAMGLSSVVPAEANSLRMGIKAYRDIRPPKEDLWETVQGHATHGTVLGDADVDINRLTGGHRLSDPATRKRVDALKAKIGGDDGYIERLIVDDTGNVIEGAHRLDALRELGVKTVPATVIRDLGRGVSTDKAEAAVRAAGETRGEQSRQIVQNVLEMANDAGLDNIAANYTFPRGFEASHQAAIDALKGATLETAEQVKARLAPRPGIRAYHGSPHDFDQFDMSKIGTGEGAQAYGHGLYMAENEGVAQSYKQNWGIRFRDRTPLSYAGDEWEKFPKPTQRVLRWVKDEANLKEAIFNAETQGHQDIADEIKRLAAKGDLSDAPPGRMYEVDIAAEPEHFLDWDKPLSEQSPQVLEAVEKAGLPTRRESKWYAEKIGREQRPVWHNQGYYITQNGPNDFVYGKGSHYDQTGVIGFASTKEAAQEALEKTGMEMPSKLGQEVLRDLKYETVGAGPDFGSQASQRLREAGIPGIRYLDQGSRGAVNVNEMRGTVSMLETAAKKHPEDASLQRRLVSARQQLADAEKGLTSNYVVFDDKLISILKKYGLPISAAGLAALSQLHPQEAQAAQKKGKR